MAPPSDPRLVIWRSEYKETKKSAYCPIVRQLCHIDATNRIPPAPEKCPSCDYAFGTFAAFLTYKAEQAGMWLFKCNQCESIYRPRQVGPSPVVAEAIRKQLEENAMASFEAAAQKDEDKAIKQALIQSKRESQQRQKAMLHQEKAMASIDRIRTDASREHEKDLQKASGKAVLGKKPAVPKTLNVDRATPCAVQLIKVILWYQANEPPVPLELQVNPTEPFYLSDHDIFSDIWNGDEVKALAWCIELNAWIAGKEPISIDAKTHILLVRRDFTGHCQGFGTELRVLQAMRSSDGHRKAFAADKARKKIILGQAVEAEYIRLVFWHTNNEPPIEETTLKIHHEINESHPRPSQSCLLRLSHQIFELLRTRHEATVDVYVDAVSDWKPFTIRSNIPIDGSPHTLLVRLPSVVGMPHLGVEIEALRTPTSKAGKTGTKRSRQTSSTSQSSKHVSDDNAKALAYLAEFDSRSRSSSVESWHPGTETLGNHLAAGVRHASAGPSSAASKVQGSDDTSAADERTVLGRRNAKKVKVEHGEVKLNWQEAETVKNGQTVIDLSMLYGDE